MIWELLLEFNQERVLRSFIDKNPNFFFSFFFFFGAKFYFERRTDVKEEVMSQNEEIKEK